jgi:hypothetical protein
MILAKVLRMFERFSQKRNFAKFNQLCKISYFRENLIMYLSFNLTWNFFVFFFGKIFHWILHLFHRSLYTEKVANLFLGGSTHFSAHLNAAGVKNWMHPSHEGRHC